MDGWSIAQNCKTSLLNHLLLLSPKVSVILSGIGSYMRCLPLKEIDGPNVDEVKCLSKGQYLEILQYSVVLQPLALILTREFIH